MKITSHETKSPFGLFLTGMVLAVVLGLMVALSTSAFAMGGGGGGGGSAPAPKVTKVDDPVAKPKDEVAKVRKPVVEPGEDKTPAVSELKTKEPKEESLVIEDPDEDKTETKPDERTTEFPKPKVVEAVVGFVTSTSEVDENGGHLRLEVRSGILSKPVTLDVVVGGTAVKGTDYTISSTSLTIPADAVGAFLTLTGIDNDVYETGKTITLVLKGRLPDGVKFGTDTHTVTIVDDDEPGSEDKIVDKPDERTIDFPDSGDETTDIVSATVGFETESSEVAEFHASHLVGVRLSNPLPEPITLTLRFSGTATTADFYLPGTVTFPQGTTAATVNFVVLADADPEVSETATLTLEGNLPEGVTFAARSHTVTISADDNTITFTEPSSASIAEEGGIATIAATIFNPMPAFTEAATITVTPGGNAVRGTDYRLSVSGGSLSGNTWTLPTESSNATLTVTAVGNSVEDGDKTLTLNFAGASLPLGWNVRGTYTRTVTVVDDDVTEDETPEVVEASVGFVKSSSTVVGGSSTFLPITLSKPLPQTLKLSLSMGSNDIGAPDDPSVVSDALVFLAGETSSGLNIVRTRNYAHQLSFTLAGDLPDGVSFGIDTYTLNVEDPEFIEPTVSFGHSTSGVIEGVDTGLALQVRLNKEFSHPITVSLKGSGTGTIGEDVEIPGSVTFEPGEKVNLLWLVATDDALVEATETITLAISDVPEGLNLGAFPTHEITITDNDEKSVDNEVVDDKTVDAGDELPPGFVPAVARFVTRSSEVNEGDSVELQVELSKPLPKTVELDVHLTVWSTSASLDDVDSLPRTVTFPQGETTASLSFTVVDDSIAESNETLRIRLRSKDEFLPYVRRGSPRRHIVTIIDNDSDAEVGFGRWHLRADEGDNLSMRVELSRSLPQPLTLSVVGSAGSGDDIVVPDSLTLEPGERRKSFVLGIVDDAISESEETVTLSLEGELPDGVKFHSRTRVVTIVITDNDSDVEVGFTTSHSRIDEHYNLPLQVELSRPLSESLTLSVAGSAGSGDDIVVPDYLTIEQGEREKVFVLGIVDDAMFEGDETVTLSLGGELPNGVKFGNRTHVVTITDNDIDATVGFATLSSEVAEGESLSVQVELSHALPRSITLLVNEDFYYDDIRVPGTSTFDPGDIRVPGTLTFDPGETSKALEISTVDNGVLDEDRTFRLLLDEGWFNRLPEGVRFGTREHTVTVTDDSDDIIVGFAKSSSYVDEDEGSAEIEIILSHPLSEPLELTFEVSGTDETKSRYRDEIDIYYLTNRVTFAPGETRKILVSDIVDDLRKEERHEWARYTFTGELPEGVGYGNRTHRLYTRDNDEVEYELDEDGNLVLNDEDIRVINRDEGEVSIINEERVHRIKAANHAGKISIENLGIVDNDIAARLANSRNENHGISIKNARQGTVSGNIIAKTHYGVAGEISIENRGAVAGDVRAIQFRDGGIEIANHGTVGKDIEVKHYGAGEISIENQGTVGEAAERAMWAWHHGSGGISIENYGTARTVAYHYGEGEVSIINQGTGAVYAEHSGDDGVIRFDGNIAGWSNAFTGETIRLGKVEFKSGNEDDLTALEVYGNYEGSDGTELRFHAGPNDWDYGYLYIEGDITGRSQVSLIVEEGETIGDSTPVLIEDDFGNSQADSFYGEETVGAFDYVLRSSSGRHRSWRFVREGISDVADQSSRIPDDIIDNIVTPPGLNPDEREDEYWCLWGEQLGSHAVLGFDVHVARLMGGSMFVGTSVARNFSTSNNISVDSQITALTTSWERGGLYVGAQTRFARFISDVSTNRLSVVQNNEGTGINMSMETGYRLNMMNFQIVPQAQLTWTRVGFDDFVGPHGELVSLEDGDRVTGQLGLSWDSEWQGAEGFGRFYGGMNLRGNLDGRTSVNVSGVSIANEQKGLSVDGKLGLSYEWDEGYTIRGEVSALRDDDAEEVRADLGIKIDF